MGSIWRRAHVIKGEKSLAVPRHIVFLDTESHIFTLPDGSTQHRLRLGWACYWRRAYGRNKDKEEWYEFKTVEDFWLWLLGHTEPKVKLWVIARNVAFDFTICEGWKHLKSAGFKLTFFYGKGCVSIITVRNGSRSIAFLDSLNWFRESLEETGKRIGIPKMSIDFETATDSELSEYCKNDVLIEVVNFRHFQTFLQENKVGRLCYTRGSTAMSAYLLRHYTTKIYIHNNREAIHLERQSYRGGRVECFRLGEYNHGPYYVIDVNSLYPYVMLANHYPIRYLQRASGVSRNTLGDMLNSGSVIAGVLIDTDEPVYAVSRERTIFPVGRFRACLCTPELRYALAHSHIVEVEQAVIYDQGNIFRSFVEHFYALRYKYKDMGDREYDEFCKYMMNSLYGKFGQKAEVWRKIADCPNEPDRVEVLIDAQKPKAVKIRYVMGVCEILERHGESFDSFPAISSHVTAYGRMYLWSLMQVVGKGHYFYCDTDSLIVDKVGLERLRSYLSDRELGKLKIERETQSLCLYGPKDYKIDGKTVTKGIRKNAVCLSPGVYEQDSWPSLGGILRKSTEEPYTVKRIVKHLDRTYLKGTVTSNGEIEPFVLSVSD